VARIGSGPVSTGRLSAESKISRDPDICYRRLSLMFSAVRTAGRHGSRVVPVAPNRNLCTRVRTQVPAMSPSRACDLIGRRRHSRVARSVPVGTERSAATTSPVGPIQTGRGDTVRGRDHTSIEGCVCRGGHRRCVRRAVPTGWPLSFVPRSLAWLERAEHIDRGVGQNTSIEVCALSAVRRARRNVWTRTG
jgi:hypothetical protein